MISDSWLWGNLAGGILLALVATAALIESRSSALISKALVLWPALLILYGALTALQGWRHYGLSLFMGLGILLVLCGVQAVLVNVRKLSPWPSGGIWLGLILAGVSFQFYPLLFERLMGFVWIAVGLTKVGRERSVALEGGIPFWIQLLYLQAVLLAVYR